MKCVGCFSRNIMCISLASTIDSWLENEQRIDKDVSEIITKLEQGEGYHE